MEFTIKMKRAKLLQSGRFQAVQLPREFRIPGSEIKITKKGKQIILEPVEDTWEPLFEALSEFPDDFLKEGRKQPVIQKRELF